MVDENNTHAMALVDQCVKPWSQRPKTHRKAASTGTDIFSANVTVSNTLQDAMKSNTSDSTGFTTSESTEKTSILPDKIDLSKEKVAVFKAK